MAGILHLLSLIGWVGCPMLRTRNAWPTLWDAIIPPERTGKSSSRPVPAWPGDTPPGASRLVSLHDQRPIVEGRLGEHAEFGYEARITDNADRLVLDYDVRIGTHQMPSCSSQRSSVLSVGSAGVPGPPPTPASTTSSPTWA